MRKFIRLTPSVWLTPEMQQVKEQGIEAVALAFYLLTAPASTMLGIYRLPYKSISKDLMLGAGEVENIIQKLIDVEFCEYDTAQQTVWVCDMAKQQVGETFYPNDKRLSAVHRLVAQLPKLSFFEKFHDRYAEVFRLDEQINVDTTKYFNNKSKSTSTDKYLSTKRENPVDKLCAYAFNGIRCHKFGVVSSGIRKNAKWYCQAHAVNK